MVRFEGLFAWRAVFLTTGNEINFPILGGIGNKKKSSWTAPDRFSIWVISQETSFGISIGSIIMEYFRCETFHLLRLILQARGLSRLPNFTSSLTLHPLKPRSILYEKRHRSAKKNTNNSVYYTIRSMLFFSFVVSIQISFNESVSQKIIKKLPFIAVVPQKRRW